MSGSGRALAAVLQVLPEDPAVAWSVAALLFVLLVFSVAVGYRRTGATAPVDSGDLLDAVQEPLAVLDSDDTVVLANAPFRETFGRDRSEGPIADVLGAHPRLREAVVNREHETVAIERGGKTRRYEVQTYPLGDDSGSRQRIVLLHDVTDHHRKRAQLEAENEKLERFASLVSHDLRNPLDVAIGRTNAVAEMVDDPELETHLARTRESHQRMRQIITDLLALARDGHSVGELECVPLETAAMDAWSHVETDAAAIAVRTQLVIEADRGHLTRLLENLFRNAVQHAGSGVTIEVGAPADGTGFFVSDDGPGIDPEKRDAVLKAGYTGGENGTGLGLAIVASIAEAHGWETRVTDAEGGGARFEFSGVEEVTSEPVARGD